MSGHWVDLARWPRRAHYDFFRQYELPFFNLCTEVEAGATWRRCKALGQPFSLACWFAVLQAIEAEPALRLRIRAGGVWAHDHVYVATTVALPDETFGFCHYPWAADFARFVRGAEAAVEALRERADPVDDRPEEDGLIHGSVLPWVRFTGLSHARRLGAGDDSVPKIVLGKLTETATGGVLPVSIEAHHALVDGVHAARFFAALEALLSQPEAWLPPP